MRDGPNTDSVGTDGSDDAAPGVPATRRARAKSAALWGLVGGFAFLVLAQGYLLLDGSIPFAYSGLFAVAAGLTAVAAAIVYVTEHRVRAKRRT